MSRDSRELLGPTLFGAGALVVGLTMVAISDRASAQYYCDERYQDCYRQPPPPPQLPFPFGLFQPREVAPPPPPPRPQSEPRQSPPRPGNTELPPLDPSLARQYSALYAPVSGEPFAV